MECKEECLEQIKEAERIRRSVEVGVPAKWACSSVCFLGGASNGLDELITALPTSTPSRKHMVGQSSPPPARI
jgi:hypothetical protein